MNTTDNKTARRLLSFVEEFRKLNATIQAQQIVTFLHIVSKPGITMSEIAKMTGTSTSAASRNAAALGDTHRGGDKGLGLVRYEIDPMDTRVKRFFPTTKGISVYNTLIQLLGN